MTPLDFTNNPQIGDAFFASYKAYKNFNSKWELVKTEIFSDGVIQGGNASDPKTVVSAGVASSDFAGTQVDCGGA